MVLHDVGDDETTQTIPGNVRFFIERLEYFVARETRPVRQIILEARAIPDIDVTAAEQLGSFIARLNERGIRLVVAEAHLPLREVAIRLGLADTFAEDTSYLKLSAAVAEFEQQEAPKG